MAYDGTSVALVAGRAAGSAFCKRAKKGYVDLVISSKCKVLPQGSWLILSIAEAVLSRSLPRGNAIPHCRVRECLEIATNVGCERAGAACRRMRCAAEIPSHFRRSAPQRSGINHHDRSITITHERLMRCWSSRCVRSRIRMSISDHPSWCRGCSCQHLQQADRMVR